LSWVQPQDNYFVLNHITAATTTAIITAIITTTTAIATDFSSSKLR